MALIISTTTLRQVENDFIGIPRGSGQSVFTFYIQYTKGNETSIFLAFSQTFKQVSSSIKFSVAETSGSNMIPFVRSFIKTGNYAITVPFPDSAGDVILTLSSTGDTPTGTVVIDGGCTGG